MQLGKTLVGAIIGAVLGIGLLVGAFLVFGLDAVWLAIPVAVLTGLGVRMMVSTSGHASYLRGAITGILALAAYLAGCGILQKVAVNRAEAPRSGAAAKAPEPASTETPEEPADPADDAPALEPAKETPLPVLDPGKSMQRGMGQQQVKNPLEYVWLGIAALIAYELGRGSSPKTSPVSSAEPKEHTPSGTHPDA